MDEAARAEFRRRTWSFGVGRIASPPVGDVLAAVWAVSMDAWATSGRDLPDYQRADMPGKVIRPDDAA